VTGQDAPLSGDHGHIPVLMDRCVGLLAPALLAPGAVVADCTLGMGGHAEALLSTVPGVRLIGLDRDPAALERSGRRLAGFGERVTLVHAVFDELPRVLADLGLTAVQGLLFDLGVSSLQLDDDGRGFAYSRDTTLDMRMDPTAGTSAAEVLATYSVAELTRVLRDYGEERFARRIAGALDRERTRQPITSTARLAELVRAAVPAATRRTGGHPAKRTFQALRIEVNDELGVLRSAIPAALQSLSVGGRLVVMSYQSLEDRIVKKAMEVGLASDVPPELPFVPEGRGPWLRRLAWGITPTQDEVQQNPRASSARLRAVEKVRAA
jgi:16S rRNA (cytosine1402-N4)-methyltransferase